MNNPFDLNNDGKISRKERIAATQKKKFQKLRDDGVDFEKAIQEVSDRAVNDYPTAREINLPKDGFFERVFKSLKIKATLEGKTKVGRIAGVGLNVLGFVFPRIDKIRNTGKKALSLTNINTDDKNMSWIIERLQEKTTWRGITVAATAVGVSLSPELKEAIIAVGVAAFGLVEVIAKEDTKQ